MSANRRSAERLPILGNLPAEVMVFQPMSIKDIGLGGLTIEASYQLQLGSVYDVRLTLGERVLVVKGRVMHSRVVDMNHDAVTYSAGLKFIDPSDQVTSAIADYLARVKTERAGGSVIAP